MRIRHLGVLAVLVTVISAGVLSAAINNKETQRIAAAAAVLEEIRSSPDRDIPKDLWDRAACVASFPR